MKTIFQYSCELQVCIPHLAFRQSNEIHMEKMLSRRVSTRGKIDCLPMWFYFYKNDIKDPLTIIQHEDGDVELHPGTNRWIGRSIRGDAPWLSARILTIDNPWQHRLEGIRNESLLDCRSFDYKNKNDFYANEELHTWSHGGYAPTGRDWLGMPEEWAHEHLGMWGGILILHNGTKHYVNRQAKKFVKVNVSKHTGLMSACRKLFEKLDTKMEKQ